MANLFETFAKNKGIDINKGIFNLLKWLVGIAGVLIVLSIIFPKAVTVILNITWVVIISVSAVFLVLGILVVIGLRKEASHILDVLVEGSLRFIDVLEFLKLLYKRFIELLKEFILYIAPILAFICSAIIYVLLLVVYKTVGKTYDVTLFTVIITIALVVTVGLLNKPRKEPEVIDTWGKTFKSMFKKGFIDGFEVVLFIFFLTIDSTKLFFLSDDLNVKIYAEFKGYDLMLRGFTVNNHLRWTINIVAIAITSEVIRYALRVITSAKRYYAQIIEPRRSVRIKIAIRMAFGHVKNEIVRFITFTTIILAVFLVFPRLKLMSLAITSLTNFVMDILIPERRVIVRGKDLLNRVIDKVFRL